MASEDRQGQVRVRRHGVVGRGGVAKEREEGGIEVGEEANRKAVSPLGELLPRPHLLVRVVGHRRTKNDAAELAGHGRLPGGSRGGVVGRRGARETQPAAFLGGRPGNGRAAFRGGGGILGLDDEPKRSKDAGTLPRSKRRRAKAGQPEEDQRRRRRNVSPNAVAVAAAGDAVAAAVAAAGDAERVEEELEIIFEKLLCDVSVGAVTGRRNKPPRPKALASRVPKKSSRLSTTMNLIISHVAKLRNTHNISNKLR